MRVLVTGGAGFIGSHLCESLLGDGMDVIALDSFDDFYDPSVKHANLRACDQSNRFLLLTGDIRDEAAVEAALSGGDVEVIVHLAARAGVRPSIEQPVLYQDVNVGGTMVLLEAARRHRVRKFVLASSSSVYGNNKKIPFHESDRVDHPISPYAATKKACELFAHTYHHLFDIDITCLRFFTVYGPRQRPDLAIHKFTRLIEQGRSIPVFGDGRTSRDYTYIDDIIDGVRRAMDRCDGYHVYNLGESCPVTLSSLIEMLEHALDKRATIERLPPQPGDVERTYADVSLARADLGYCPTTTFDVGLRRFVEWFRAR